MAEEVAKKASEFANICEQNSDIIASLVPPTPPPPIACCRKRDLQKMFLFSLSQLRSGSEVNQEANRATAVYENNPLLQKKVWERVGGVKFHFSKKGSVENERIAFLKRLMQLCSQKRQGKEVVGGLAKKLAEHTYVVKHVAR